MDAHVAKGLVNELVNRRGIVPIDAEKLEHFLGNRLVLATEPHSAICPGDFYSQPTNVTNGYFYFDPTQVLSNNAMPDLKVGWGRTLTDELLEIIGVDPSSETLVRELANDPHMASIMRINRNPFALLGNLKTFRNTEVSGDAPLVSSTKPLLVLPGTNDRDRAYIDGWEESHARYFKEEGFLGRGSRISRDEFLALS